MKSGSGFCLDAKVTIEADFPCRWPHRTEFRHAQISWQPAESLDPTLYREWRAEMRFRSEQSFVFTPPWKPSLFNRYAGYIDRIRTRMGG